jgi:hypothetical protein
MRIPWSVKGVTARFGRGSPPASKRNDRGKRNDRRWWRLTVPLLGVAVVAQLSLVGAAGMAAASTTTQVAPAASTVAPNPVNELDCNGWSKAYQTVRKLAGVTCTDPIRVIDGKGTRFDDNHWYVGHDEPSVKFISSAPGSANTMTYLMKVPVDPRRSPTPSGSVTNYGQLSVAPWFGLPMCDPDSYPQNPCTPDSDSNLGSISNPADAGSAFMELQLYPPGYTPFVDSESCSATKWCAALTIDSLECNFGFATCNNNCEEPTNFAFLQTNGVPAGPPSPQLADVSTFLPNSSTLLINQGDVLQISITDPPQGFTTTIRDLTTHQTGFMTASAANGFMNTSISTCAGTPYTFHAEYSTASAQNGVPWAALEGGVLMEEEIGHSEVCSSLANQDPVAETYANGESYTDDSVYDTCDGGSEGPGQTGEGPCNSAAICQNAETQGPEGPQACPTDNADSGTLCEYADGYCFPQGSRTVLINGVSTTASADANQCFADRFQNGDLDFDGLSYQSSAWPNGGPNHPTAVEYAGPFTNGKPYPQIQFETDIGGSSFLCDTATGVGCTAPPISAEFYPYWSLSPQRFALGARDTSCVWNFGGQLPDTLENFGKDAEYGTPDLNYYGGTNISPVQANPEFGARCAGPI